MVTSLLSGTAKTVLSQVVHHLADSYTVGMSSRRLRHVITETDELASALDTAENLWPECQGQRGALLGKLIDAGIDFVNASKDSRQRAKLDAIEVAAGSMPGMWPAKWREQTRSEWPD